MSKIVVIGGGAAGMMAAYTAAANGHEVTLLEKNEKLGKKIYITGKGRCNFTNICDFQTFINNVVTNPKFMYSSLRAWTPQDMLDFLEESGCRTKVERGNRAFPESDHASDVTAALQRRMKSAGVRVELDTEVLGIESESTDSENAENVSQNLPAPHPGFKISAKHTRTGKRRVLSADSVIIATGGLSYPSTGSTGDGYRFAEKFKLKQSGCFASLVPLETAENDYAGLHDINLKNVALTMWLEPSDKSRSGFGKIKLMESEPGELQFTQVGLSGPLVLSASALAAKYLKESADGNKAGCDVNGGSSPASGINAPAPGSPASGSPACGINAPAPGSPAPGSIVTIEIDLKPALSMEMLDARVLRDFEAARNSDISSALEKLLITSLRPIVLRRAGIDGRKKVRDITKEERARLVHVIKHLEYHVTGTRGYNEAIVTHGGISVSEINPRTMECKNVPGLYFAGEVLDVDAFTGGFNLQIAWSTGHAAGSSVG